MNRNTAIASLRKLTPAQRERANEVWWTKYHQIFASNTAKQAIRLADESRYAFIISIAGEPS